MHRRHLDATSPINQCPSIESPIAVEPEKRSERDRYVVYGRQTHSELGDKGVRKPQEKSEIRCNVAYFRTPLPLGIVPNEQISRDLNQRMSELSIFQIRRIF